MKIGIAPGILDADGYGRWGDDAYRKLIEHGFSAADFDMVHTDSRLYTAPWSVTEGILLRQKELAAEAGVEITQVHGPWRWPPKDDTPENRAERLEKMKKSIAMTAVLGCRNWVIHPIMPFGVNEAGTEVAAKTWDMNLEFMGQLLQTAKFHDVTICFENMPMLDFSLSKPVDILRFVKEMNDEHFKICLDTGHVSVFRELNLAEEVRRLGDEIRVLHVHDNKNSLDLHLFPYQGVIDWPEFAKALKDVGYSGSFSLEVKPSGKLPDDIFGDLCKGLAKTGAYIVRDI